MLGQLREPRRFLQIITGARQVGKTTLITQVAEQSGLAHRFASAANLPCVDQSGLRNSGRREVHGGRGGARRPAACLSVSDGIAVDEFLSKPVEHWVCP